MGGVSGLCPTPPHAPRHPSQSSQPHFEMEILAQRTRVIMQDKESILQENERLKAKLDMVNRLNSAQATKLEELKQKKKK